MTNLTEKISRNETLDWALRALQVVVLLAMAAIAWQGREVLTKVDDHEQRLTTVESSQFTREMGAELQKQVSEVRIELAALKQSSTDTQRRLEKIDEKLDRLLARGNP